MSDHEREDEKQPIIRTSRETGFLRGRMKKFPGPNCGCRFSWLCFSVLLMGRVAGLTMFTIWVTDCFFREFHTTPICKKFLLFPSPKTFRSVWLSMCIGTSLFLIFHVCHFSFNFCGTIALIRYLIRKMYFYKITCTLLVVVGYDLIIILDEPNTGKTISYVLFMLEKTGAVTVMFYLNFLPQFWRNGDPNIKWWLYKIALAVYSLECHVLALLGSTVAVYKVLTVSEPEQSDGPPGVKAVFALMLLITNNGLRLFMGDFFLRKLFDESVDVLGSARATTKIEETIEKEMVESNQRDRVMVRVTTPIDEILDVNGGDQP